MYCKRCKFHSFDHLKDCPKCGITWEESRQALGLAWLAAATSWETVSVPESPDAELSSAQDVQAHISADLDADLASLDFSETDPVPAPEQAAPPEPPSSPQDDGLDVSHIPDLDFSLDFSEPELEQPRSPAADDHAPADMPEAQSLLVDLGQDELSVSDQSVPAQQPAPVQPEEKMIELDFSLDFSDADSSAQAGPGSKRGELFIPELEEMLIPLEEPRPAPKAKPKEELPPEEDFFLDFDLDETPTLPSPSSTATALELELDLLEQEEKKQP
ncbi:MAG: hypothetical protein GX055_03980 [Desulfovibrionales bacterium]|nr:hypothetical protein [Desulfovibrionales bacterium]